MSIQVKFFGMLADAAGTTGLVLEDSRNTDALKEKLFTDFPSLKNMPFVIAVNKKIVRENKQLSAGDTVALLPPFAGG